MIKKTIIIISFFLCVSCSTHKVIYVTSNPSGASVVADGKSQGDTPCKVKLKKDGLDHYLFITKHGYRKVRKIVREEDRNSLHIDFEKK